ncbi:MAG: hypothetical protein HYV02_04125 [Deltaproteobacteria bacterium]|nr:hypothetical protein [Deltaproteobacteria bacterium]
MTRGGGDSDPTDGPEGMERGAPRMYGTFSANNYDNNATASHGFGEGDGGRGDLDYDH